MYFLWYNGNFPDATNKIKTLKSHCIYGDKNSAKCVATGDAVRHSPAGRTLLCFRRSKAPFTEAGPVKVSLC